MDDSESERLEKLSILKEREEALPCSDNSNTSALVLLLCRSYVLVAASHHEDSTTVLTACCHLKKGSKDPSLTELAPT